MKTFLIDFATDEDKHSIPNPKQGAFRIKGELIKCKDCRNLLTVAWIGDEAEPYAWMCDHWHMSTEPEGFCHKAKRRKDGNDQQGDSARPID